MDLFDMHVMDEGRELYCTHVKYTTADDRVTFHSQKVRIW